MGPVTRAVQTGIGLFAELKAAKVEQKASGTSVRNGPSGVSPERPEQIPDLVEQLQIDDKRPFEVEEDSENDEHFGGAAPPSYESQVPTPPESEAESPPPYPGQGLVATSDMEFPRPPSNIVASRLQYPVIIPQRRPGTKIRGFVRAYAPVLADHDIDQDTFLNFLKVFHKSSQASPTLTVFTIGVGALGNIPEPGAMLLGISLQAAGLTAMEFQSRRRANTYLDKANDELFKPRGLYCLVMSFRPDDVPTGEVAMQEVDTSKDALKWLAPPTSSFKTSKGKFRKASGITRGESALPESAPLIYPETGYAEIGKSGEAEDEGEHESKRASFSRRKVVQGYFDKRAQANYAYKHPESSLAVEAPPKFASKYGDPNHPAVTASHVGRISNAMGKESLEERQARKRAKAMGSRNPGGRIKRVLQDSVLYLMIVNLPIEKEIEELTQVARSDPSRSSRDLSSPRSA